MIKPTNHFLRFSLCLMLSLGIPSHRHVFPSLDSNSDYYRGDPGKAPGFLEAFQTKIPCMVSRRGGRGDP